MTETTDRLESGDRVQLKFPARGDLIVLARLVTSAISARAGFDIEELEDLRLAVGELCLLTLQGSDAQHGDLCLQLDVLGDAIEVVCTLERAGVASALHARRGRSRPAQRADSRRAGGRARKGEPGRLGACLATEAPGGACGVTEGRENDPGPLSDAEESDRPALDPAAREELITANLGLAHQLARRFLHRGEPLDDLVQVASVALVKSVDRFDPSRGVDFAAFATRTIIGELKRHFRDKGWAVRASRRVQELYLELGHATGTLVQQLGRNPTVAELAEATGASEEAVIEAIEAGQGYRAASIDASESEDDPLSARLGEQDGNYDSVEDRALLGPALATLPEREQSILRMRFVEGLTQSEIAAAVGVSQMHVSRLLSSSLQKLREGIGQTEAGRR